MLKSIVHVLLCDWLHVTCVGDPGNSSRTVNFLRKFTTEIFKILTMQEKGLSYDLKTSEE